MGINYSEKTEAYNDRRYGKPWIAIISTSLSRDYKFIDWDGMPGRPGSFHFAAAPGTLLAYGQKDLRKSHGGVDGYQICLPDGSLPRISSALAAELLLIDAPKRWERVARVLLDAAMTRPKHDYDVKAWEKTRNEDAARYSAILGVENPITAELARALGLTEEQPEAKPPVIDISGFGL